VPAKSQAQAKWARAGCPGSKMKPGQCEDFVPHGKGSMKRLPKKASKKS
jgi:hypothetical protein